MCAVIEPRYASGKGRGRKPFALNAMQHVHVAQIVYNYSDPDMEDALYEIESLRRFCGIRLEAVPDESTILQYRHLLEQHGLSEQIFEEINQTPGERGLFLRAGIDNRASLIAAPTSTKNQTKARDPEMHSSKKGNQWFFGSKFHIGVDSETGLVHTLKVTAGNVSDVAEAANLLHGEEHFVHGDAGYQSLDRRPEMPTENPPACVIAMRLGKLKKLTQDESTAAKILRDAARELASRRAEVEHVFWAIKIRFGYAKNRYRGLAKNAARLTFLTAIANVLRGEAHERRCLIASAI
ncbi:IS5 family transposase [Methylomonas rhizoryzae]|uniref:IS5 family transposase n=1 Tax=Methylomonas rhizoryzae TaxID=2608981 RepID=UPI0012320FBA|nr:IS5 family transposase [Methylomonas rhizoryzae]